VEPAKGHRHARGRGLRSCCRLERRGCRQLLHASLRQSGYYLDYAYWSSTDISGKGSPIHRVTTQSSKPRIQFVGLDDEGKPVQGLFIGDYTAVALGSDGRLHPCWTDFRGKPGVSTPNQESYTESIHL